MTPLTPAEQKAVADVAPGLLSLSCSVAPVDLPIVGIGTEYVLDGGIWQSPKKAADWWSTSINAWKGAFAGQLPTVLYHAGSPVTDDTPVAVAAHTPADDLAALVPALKDYSAVCPECPANQSPTPLRYLIQHLNDAHEWTRERIADYLDTLDVDLTLQPANSGN